MLPKIAPSDPKGYKAHSIELPEDVSLLDSISTYVKSTWSLRSLYQGSQKMFGNMFSMLDNALPFNTWLQKKYGLNKSDTFFIEVLTLAAGLVSGVAFLPSCILTGAMLFGIGASIGDYGKGLYSYQTALFKKDLGSQRNAIEIGQESSFAFLLGASFLGLAQGLPKLANSQILKLPAGAIERLKSVAQGACLLDDPVHLGNAVRKLTLGF